MRMRTRVAWLLAMALASASAIAGPAEQDYVGIEQRLTAEQLREVGLTPAQLDLLNRYLREAQPDEPVADTQRREEPQDAPAEESRGAMQYIGLDDAPIKSRVTGVVDGWAPGTVFALENGQQWKVLKGSMRLRTPLQSPEIVVVPGFAGRWFLQVDEDMPKARVYRID
jgi:hypothetical protein